MKWTLCQVSSILSDSKSNQKKVQTLVQKHKDCDLLIFPELHLMGYPPQDLLEQPHLLKRQQKVLKSIQIKKSDPDVLLGACTIEKEKLFNSAVYISQQKRQVFHKNFLAISDTFDEMRFFAPGKKEYSILHIQNKKILILICEDLWKIQKIPTVNIDFIICINASPFFPEQLKNRLIVARKLTQRLCSPLFYVNRVGGQDEWIFDGSSFVLNQKGELVFQAPSFKEHIEVIDTKNLKKKKQAKPLSSIQQKQKAIQLGIKDFLSHHQFKKIHLGLSGGLDSALTLSLCKEVVGAKNMTAFFLPSPFSKKISQKLSQRLAESLGIVWILLPITDTYHQIVSMFKKLSPVAKENIQARLRSLFLMAYSNTHSSLLIGTSNKSELATGYATLYGDLSGAFFPIGDLYKTEIQQMAKICYPSPIMNQILKQPPSAELKKGQVDEDALPSYSVLDTILKNLIENQKEARTTQEKKIDWMIRKNEFKRKQSPFVLKLSAKAFGIGRRYPTIYEV